MKTSNPRFKKIPTLVAHRGASYRAPENTIPSYRLAWSEGADKIEGDFWLTADERIVCIHDPTTERTAPGQKVIDVRNACYEDLLGYDVGIWKSGEYSGTRIPVLEDILAEVPEGRGIYIEIKQNAPRIIYAILRVIDASPVDLHQATLISFSSEIVSLANRLSPEMRTFLLYDPDGEEDENKKILLPAELVSLALDSGADGVGLGNSTRVDARFVNKIRDAGLEFHVWTVNSLEDALRYIELGVDSLTTDRPLGLRTELEEFIRGAEERM